LIMAQDYNLQDVVRCKCENLNPELYCTLCQINLCKTCAVEHLLDESKLHMVIPIKQLRSTSHYPTCPTHSTKQCELHCAICDIPICTQCVSSEEHSEHKAEDIMTTFQTKKETLQSDIQELDKSIIHKYQEMAKGTKIQKDRLNEKSQKLLKLISKLAEDWHREIDTITQKETTKVEVVRTNCMHALDKQEFEISVRISKIWGHIADLKKLLESRDVYKICSYKSNIAELRRLPTKVILNIPTFSSQKINTEQLHELFGALSEYSIEKDNQTGDELVASND
uniref:B box-type domain-containing protein n=1 Tax=Magallana gigas TaxID=29159 RepID=A0A8W8MAZ9_MAGGI